MWVIAALLASTALASTMSKEEKDQSFFQGLENGFFLRNEDQGYKKYDCPDLVLDQRAQQRFNQAVAPVTMAINMMPNNEKVMDLWNGVQLFIQEVASF